MVRLCMVTVMTCCHTVIMYEIFLSQPQRNSVWRAMCGSNVCRCIPNWEIVFLVIAISIFASISLPSHFKLSFISLPHPCSSPACAHTAPPNCCPCFPPIFRSSWKYMDSALESVGVRLLLFIAEKTGRLERTFPDYHALWYFLQKVSHKYTRSHKRAQLLRDPNY